MALQYPHCTALQTIVLPWRIALQHVLLPHHAVLRTTPVPYRRLAMLQTRPLQSCEAQHGMLGPHPHFPPIFYAAELTTLRCLATRTSVSCLSPHLSRQMGNPLLRAATNSKIFGKRDLLLILTATVMQVGWRSPPLGLIYGKCTTTPLATSQPS